MPEGRPSSPSEVLENLPKPAGRPICASLTYAARRLARHGPPLPRSRCAASSAPSTGPGPGDRGQPRRRPRRQQFQSSFSKVDEFDLIKAAVKQATQPRSPSSCSRARHRAPPEEGPRDGCPVARIATHCTEADVSVALRRGPQARHGAVGFLMLSHKAARPSSPAGRIMVDAGAQCVYVVARRGSGASDAQAGQP